MVPSKKSVAAAVLALLVLAACARPATTIGSADSNAGAVPVTAVVLRYERIGEPIELSGSLAAVQSSTIGAASAGRVLGVNVRVGDVVRAGDAIAEIDSSASAAALAQAHAGAAAAAASETASRSTIAAAAASIASANAQVDAARARAALSAITAGRMTALFAQGAVSKQQDDQAHADLAAAHATLAQAQAGLDGARKNLAGAQAQSRAAAEAVLGAEASVSAAQIPLRDATVRAPFAGMIVNKFVEPGAVVVPGSPVVALENSRNLEVAVAAPDDAVGDLVPGTPVTVRVDAAGGAPISGWVRAIVPAQNPALRSAILKIAVPSRPGLQPGMFARVSLVVRGHAGWVAPLDSLVTRAGQSGVFVVRDGIASFVPLQTGAVEGTTVELVGIHGRGTQVAVGNLERLNDGSRVTVKP